MISNKKTFRVFLSSTFSDMRLERGYIQKHVVKELEEYCASKGASFQLIDLRWGVSEDAQLNQKTMDICLGEIKRCQQISPKPNFLILLGNRYGWQTIPAKIPAEEFDEICKKLINADRIFIEEWYKLDDNAVPPHYVLQPRTEEYVAYDKWVTVEQKILGILRTAVDKLPFTEDQRIKYFTSATHQEIVEGCLGVDTANEHVFAYIREIANKDKITSKEFIDITNGKIDKDAQEKQEKLKKTVINKISKKHVFTYEATVKKEELVCEDLTKLGERIIADLKSVIDNEIGDQVEETVLAMEQRHQKSLQEHLVKNFVGRGDVLNDIENYVKSDEKRVFGLVGESGSGKSSILAKAIGQVDVTSVTPIFRFLGTSSQSMDTDALLSSLTDEIIALQNVTLQSLLDKCADPKEIDYKEIFLHALVVNNANKNIVIFLDAIDQLRDWDKDLKWIPEYLAAHIKLVVSFTPVVSVISFTPPNVEEKFLQISPQELNPFNPEDAGELLELWLQGEGRTLQKEQKKNILKAFNKNGIPLYLRLLFEQAKEWHSYDEPVKLPSTIKKILQQFFKKLEDKYGVIIKKIVQYMLSGRYRGLTEQEILELLVFDEETWEYCIEESHVAHREEIRDSQRFPIAIWAQIFADLQPYFVERNANGERILTFESSLIKYLYWWWLRGGEKRKIYILLSNYFEKQLTYIDNQENFPNIRKATELRHKKLYVRIKETPKESVLFIVAKLKAMLIKELLEDYPTSPFLSYITISKIGIFIQENLYLLETNSIFWPSYKIFIQIAKEYGGKELKKPTISHLKTLRNEWVYLLNKLITDSGIKPYFISPKSTIGKRVIGETFEILVTDDVHTLSTYYENNREEIKEKFEDHIYQVKFLGGWQGWSIMIIFRDKNKELSPFLLLNHLSLSNSSWNDISSFKGIHKKVIDILPFKRLPESFLSSFFYERNLLLTYSSQIIKLWNTENEPSKEIFNTTPDARLIIKVVTLLNKKILVHFSDYSIQVINTQTGTTELTGTNVLSLHEFKDGKILIKKHTGHRLVIWNNTFDLPLYSLDDHGMTLDEIINIEIHQYRMNSFLREVVGGIEYIGFLRNSMYVWKQINTPSDLHPDFSVSVLDSSQLPNPNDSWNRDIIYYSLDIGLNKGVSFNTFFSNYHNLLLIQRSDEIISFSFKDNTFGRIAEDKNLNGFYCGSDGVYTFSNSEPIKKWHYSNHEKQKCGVIYDTTLSKKNQRATYSILEKNLLHKGEIDSIGIFEKIIITHSNNNDIVLWDRKSGNAIKKITASDWIDEGECQETEKSLSYHYYFSKTPTLTLTYKGKTITWTKTEQPLPQKTLTHGNIRITAEDTKIVLSHKDNKECYMEWHTATNKNFKPALIDEENGTIAVVVEQPLFNGDMGEGLMFLQLMKGNKEINFEEMMEFYGKI